MVEDSTLSSIRAAEKRAIELRALAEKETQKSIEAAQRKAIEIAASSEKGIERKTDAALKKFYDELKRRKDAIISKGTEASENQRKAGEKKLPRAIDFLFQEFQKEVERA